jgi:two-component system, NarL family, nitrate/nitrite response regulator NarL
VDASGVRTLAVDDHPAVREALRDLVSAAPGFVLVGLAASGEEALRDVARLSPQFVIMDICMPGIGGIEAARAIVNTHPDIAILMTSVDEPLTYRDEEQRGVRLAWLRKQTISADSLSLTWAALSN